MAVVFGLALYLRLKLTALWAAPFMETLLLKVMT